MKCEEIFAALALLEKERGIPQDFMLEKIVQALVTAYKRDHEDVENVVVDVNEEKHDLKMFVEKTVVEEVENPAAEISAGGGKGSLRQVPCGRHRALPGEECGLWPHRRRQRQAGHHPGPAGGRARHDL